MVRTYGKSLFHWPRVRLAPATPFDGHGGQYSDSARAARQNEMDDTPKSESLDEPALSRQETA